MTAEKMTAEKMTAENGPGTPDNRPTIAVVGAPGSGKSTVGALLAARLGWEFTDVDQIIAEDAGKPVAEIFADDGEPEFRRLEVAATLARLADPGVVSLGGGAVVNEEVRRALVDGPPAEGRATSAPIVLWLKVSAGQSARRVGLNEPRPLLLGNVRGRLIALLNERTPLYEAVATHTVDTDDATPEQVLESIMERLRERGIVDD